MTALAARLAPNWTTVAGALEGILDFLGSPLPRHAVMGLTAHAWHVHLAVREGVAALPSGPTEMNWDVQLERYGRLGFAWERFTGSAAERPAAIGWATERIDAGRPLIGWDLRLHDFAVVHGVDTEQQVFLIDDRISGQAGDIAPWDSWPSDTLGRIDFFCPGEPHEVDAGEAVLDSLTDAINMLRAADPNGGTNGLEAWADALAGPTEVDRAGNAYTLQVLQAARMDGGDYLASLRDVFPGVDEPLSRAYAAVQKEVTTLAPLITLFPFPAGGHGNVANPGLREAASVALRRAAQHERALAEALEESLAALTAG